MPGSRRWTYGLDWNLLRTFLVIAEERSVTRAADRLLLQQPSVSAALKRLEETFQCRLFERGRRPMTLTPQGEVLFAQCRDLYRAIAGLEPKLSAAPSSLTGTVRLAMVTQLVNDELDDVFRRLHGKHPGISFSVEVSTSHDIVRAVSQQITPFGICLLTKPLPTLTSRFLFRETFGIYCGPGHPLFGASDIGLRDIRAEPWVSFACAEVSNSLEPMLALRLGADLSSRVAAVSPDLQEVRRFISAGIGIGILPIATASRDVADGRLWPLVVPGSEDLGADVYFLSNPAAQYDPAEQAFLDEMAGFGRH
jgi:DNA-binding transcriptional LysR family regulator